VGTAETARDELGDVVEVARWEGDVLLVRGAVGEELALRVDGEHLIAEPAQPVVSPELGLGDEGVDDVGDHGALFVGQLVEFGEAGVDVAAGSVEGPSFGVGEVNRLGCGERV
jgi:hypothetical protein